MQLLNRLSRIGALILAVLAVPANAAVKSAAQTSVAAPTPAVEGFGTFQPVPGAAEQPSTVVKYRLIFNVTKAAASPDKVSPSLERVARFLNTLAHYGIRPQPSDIVAIVHGPATSAVLNDQAYRSRNAGTANPNLKLINALREAGVSIRVCGQALAVQKLPVAEVEKGVQVDVGAIVTIANFQSRGYALIPD